MRLQKIIDKLRNGLIEDATDNPDCTSYVATVTDDNGRIYSVCVCEGSSVTYILSESDRYYENVENYISSQLDYGDIHDAVTDDEDDDIWHNHGYNNEVEYWRERI